MVGEFGGHGLAVPGHLWFGDGGADRGGGLGLGLLEDPLLAAAREAAGGGGGDGVAWGYGGLPTTTGEYKERYRVSLAALRELMDQGVAAGVYTQTTDVEGEVNGLLTYDRRVAKVDPRDLREWHAALFGAAVDPALLAAPTTRRRRLRVGPKVGGAPGSVPGGGSGGSGGGGGGGVDVEEQDMDL